MFYTYIYHDPERNVPMYVGKGKDKRAKFHLSKATNIRLKNRLLTLKDKGLVPIIEIIPAESEDIALQEEINLIAKYGRLDLGLGTLYNATDGGEGKAGHITSEETKVKISKANSNPSAETRLKQSSWVRGEDVSKKISISRLMYEATLSKEDKFIRASKKTKQFLSEETLAKQTAIANARAPVECPHCHKVGKIPGMSRHHFNNCRTLNSLTA